MRATTSGSSGYFVRLVSKNKKAVAVAGVALMAVGVWGMISIGADTLETIEAGDYDSERGEAFQMNSYVFLFALVAGLIAVIYAAVYSQAKNAPSQQLAK